MLQTIVIILGIVLSVSCYKQASVRTVNTQSQFKKWPNKDSIPYYIDPAYTTEEQQAINKALAKVLLDLHGCINMLPVQPDNPIFKVKITPFADDGVTQEEYSFSYPGFYKDLQDLYFRKEQRLVLARGPTGSFDGNIRSIMKYFLILYGKRNEHQRGDRDAYLTINSSAWKPKPINMSSNAYRLYSTGESYWPAFPYDYCSITHNKPSDFANDGQSCFTVKQAPYFIPQLPRLSNTDCQLVYLMYNCPKRETLCEPLDCASQVQGTTPTGSPPTTPTGPPTTTPTRPPSTTPTGTSSTGSTGTPTGTTGTSTGTTSTAATTSTAPPTTSIPAITTPSAVPCTNGMFTNFCSQPPTASVLYQVGQTPVDDIYVMFSANCAMTYKLGVSGSITVVQPATVGTFSNPAQIDALYPGYAATITGVTPPITSAFLFSPNGPTFLSSSAKPATNAACTFPMAPPAPPAQGSTATVQSQCYGATFPAAPAPGTLSTAAPSIGGKTAVGMTQFYVYQPAKNQLCASNVGNPTQPVPDKQCFTLSNEILPMTKVTAIQYTNDVSNPALLFFGTNASGQSVIVMGDAPTVTSWSPPTAPTEFKTYGGAFSPNAYTIGMGC